MIEPDSAGCTTNCSPDAPTPTHQQQYYQSTTSKHQNAKQSQRDLSSPPTGVASNIRYPHLNSQLGLESRLSYFQHNNLLPLVGSHFLLASSATAAAGLPAASSPLGQNAQFALTPDARACVTATYLCVLIVNNTWLDCNLLETLCNNQNNNGNNHDNDGNDNGTSSNATRPNLETAEATMKLNALESALSELIAFAGGGEPTSQLQPSQPPDDTTQGDSSAPDGVYHPLPLYSRPEEPNFSSQRPMGPYVDKGGGGDGMNFGAATTEGYDGDDAPDDGDEGFDNFEARFQGGPMARLRSLKGPVGDDKEVARVREQVLANNRVILDDQRDKQKDQIVEDDFVRGQHHLAKGRANNSSKGGAGNHMESLGNAAVSQPTQAPSTSGSLASWMGRPFRSWGSYSFWLSGSGGNNQVVRHDEPQRQQQQQVQLLRPIDRTEQYNDIVTNQSSLKQHDHPHQQPEKSAFPVATEPTGILATNDATVLVTDSNSNLNGATRGGSNNADNDNSNNQPAMFAHSPQVQSQSQQHLPVGSQHSNSNNGDDDASDDHDNTGPDAQQRFKPQHFRSSTTPAAGLMAVYPELSSSPTPGANLDGSYAMPAMTTPPGSMQRQHQANRNLQRHHQFHHHQQQHQLKFQQQPFQHHHHHHPDQDQPASTEPLQCNCNEHPYEGNPPPVGPPASPPDECKFRCPPHQPPAANPSQSQSQSLTSSQVFNSDVNQLATATTFAAPTTTLGPSAKMSPLDVTFQLYTRANRDPTATSAGDLIGLTTNDTSFVAMDLANQVPSLGGGGLVKLNSSLPIKIVIHGFGSGGRRPWVTDMVYKLLDYEDVNVIVVDWEKGATLPNYVQAAGNTRLVGHKIASLIKSINAKYGLTGNSYHLIGFSLGAHVAGFAGMEIRNSTSVPRLWINRITGLDPASPLFEGYEANDRLDPGDAQFVDVIHSNGDGVLRGGFGSLQPMGHVDFYPNGGRVQVGCNSVLLSALSDIIYGKWQSLCNHRRALNFFMDSFEFNKCRFRSFNCDSYENYLKGECFDCGHNNEKCSYMGYLANYSKGRGKMYLTTHEEAPFCANQFIIKIVGTKGFKTHWGKVEVTLVTLDGKNESFWLSSMSQQSTGGGSGAGHELGGAHHHEKELQNQQQHCMQSLIVAHPVLVNFSQVLLRYTKYKGWIYSGDESWSIDKIFITDSDGQVKSYCGFNTILESHVTSRLNLEPGNCTVIESMASRGANSAIIGQQTSRTTGNDGNPQANGQQVVSSVSLPQQQQQAQPQSQTQPTISQQPAQPPRSPRFDYSFGHTFQRIAATEPPAPFTVGYNNIPFITTF